MILEKYSKYQGAISLTKGEAFIASNNYLKRELEKAGFTNVEVTGSGTQRNATGVWSRETMEAALPKQVTEIKKL